MKTLVFLLTTWIFFQQIVALKILCLFPYQGKSHFFVFKPYLEELTRRGHNVTVVSHFPDASSKHRDISLAGTGEVMEESMPLQERSYTYLFEVGLLLMSIAVDNCEKMLALEEFKRLSKEKFDLVVTEQFNSDCGLGVAYKLRAPVVGINSHVLFPYHYDRLGAPDNVAFVPFHFIETGSRPSLWQRAEVMFFKTYFKLVFKYISQRSNRQTLEKYYGPIPDLEDLAKGIKVFLLYQYFPLTGMRLFAPNAVEVGGYHVAPVKPLPQDIQKFLNESEHGVVYVSFGSVIKAASISAEKLSAIVEALSSLKQRVIWKWENNTLPGAPANILISKWLPQNDILGHPKVVAFYSHGGMLSTTEAIHHAVPMVVMPVMGDQPANAAAVRESGLGLQLNMGDLTADSLRDKLQQVLQPEFQEKVKALSRAWHDRPLSPLQAAMFWTEWAARQQDWQPDLHSRDVPFLAYYSADLLAILVLVVFTLTAAIFKCFCAKSITEMGASRKRTKND